ncbi:beta-galactosidase [Agromyces sp. CF514]|uniref:beta-galactosidase n=1 Tax=Agromyces sp. CF514 TaxID=1881031 RepID=UPI0008E9604A|nr:beta-galactosidase [Agromyces sp. CF514]SFR70480.1 beta-galactosidase [Agromyces sp. CF514]
MQPHTEHTEHRAARPTWRHDGIAFGCDYNPEQWDPEVWPEDVRLMREAGVDLVAINIFGWSQVNPRKGTFDFAALDTVMDLLADAGIRVNLGTATASPPPWLTTLHPEILPVADDGTTRYPGGRQAWCPSSPVFRRYALALVEQVADRYGSHPNVELWHVSNELGCHNALCHCVESTASFRRWLEQRYGTIAELNRAWGTSFWSQRYDDWAEILTPMRTLSTRNPGQVLDFHRFSSEELLGYYRAEAEVIRARSTAPITTNFMVTAHIRNLDYFSWAPEMDVVANDHYLDNRLADPTTELAFAADLTRGIAGGAPWILMETSTSAVNWQPHNIAKARGEMTRNAAQHIARGADGICFFQWRASAQGSEKFHSALLPHAGTDSDVWREVVELGALLDRLDEVTGTRVVADTAVLFSWDAWWATDADNRPSHSVEYLEQVHAAYTALRATGASVDVVHPDADLSGYRLVVVPALYSVTDSAAANLESFVAAGGTTLVTFYSGIVDEHDRVRLGGYPGAFAELLGIRVEEFAPLRPGDEARLASGATAKLWAEHLALTTAEAIDAFVDGPVPGVPAVTRNEHGSGAAWYLATAPDAADYRGLVARIADEAGVGRPVGAGPEVEILRRAGDGRSYVFAINHGAEPVVIDATGFDLVTTGSVDGDATVPGYGIRIIREEAA